MNTIIGLTITIIIIIVPDENGGCGFMDVTIWLFTSVLIIDRKSSIATLTVADDVWGMGGKWWGRLWLTVGVDWSVVVGGGWITVGGITVGGITVGGRMRGRAVPLVEVVVGMG